jgi:23S rRNA pseudouridine2605 synthase
MTDHPEGERIAKVLSRAGVASRREAERMIELGQVTVNGKVITSAALNVTPKDKITVAGQPVAEPETARLWLYYKPEGLVTSASDEKGRETVFDNLPPELPRVMSVGRLDLNSEGLLLLTNDGELKRRLELPSTGWLRKYRVRVKGNPVDPDLEPLRKGITVDGERFQPMTATVDRVQGANAWLTIGLREGKNREIRRAMSAIGLTVNRLIRISYGPFRLGDLEPGAVEEVKGKTLRDQLGLSPVSEDMSGTAKARPRAPGGIPPSRPAKIAAAKAARAAAEAVEGRAVDAPVRKAGRGTPARGGAGPRDAAAKPARATFVTRSATKPAEGAARRDKLDERPAKAAGHGAASKAGEGQPGKPARAGSAVQAASKIVERAAPRPPKEGAMGKPANAAPRARGSGDKVESPTQRAKPRPARAKPTRNAGPKPTTRKPPPHRGK